MSRKSRMQDQALLQIDSEVVRQIRQHARSENKTEVCGVLIGRETDDGIDVSSCIAGVNAAQGGAHVTFTQDTWEHIYKVKDKEHPNERILGWYHSHPGFGVFLSDHDTFIHRNFFSSKRQVAWVYDPHSDEEGCFGWQGDRIVRLTRVDIVDRRGGEAAESSGQPKPAVTEDESDDVSDRPRIKLLRVADRDDDSLERMVSAVFSHLSVLLLGFAISYFLLPREKVLLMALPIDPRTMTPLGPPVPVPPEQAREILKEMSPANDGAKSPQPSGSAGSPGKEGDGDHR
jgi:proteasome lid subunit RPN8/RPN11